MPETYTLLKSQKNEVFEILQNEGLEPAHFSWADVNLMPSVDLVVPRLNYLDGKYYFQFMVYANSDNHCCEFSPGNEHVVEGLQSSYWGEQAAVFHSWTKYLQREIEAPDLWAEMGKYRISVSLALPEQIRNDPIPAYEAEEIANKLQELADKIDEQFDLDTEQNQFVRSKLDYLANAAKRQRSMDWVHTSIGVCVTIAMSLTLAPDKAGELWQLMKSLVGPFLHLIGP